MIKSTAVLVRTWNRYPNICSTLVARILSLFSVHLVNVFNHSLLNVVLKLRMPKTTRKMNKRSLWFLFSFFYFDFETLSFCNRIKYPFLRITSFEEMTSFYRTVDALSIFVKSFLTVLTEKILLLVIFG